MTRKFTKMMAAIALLTFLAVPMGMWGQTRTETTTTYTFSTKAWAAYPENWTSGKDGNQFTNGRGVQVTTGVSGANATSPVSFTNISKVEVTYSTNATAGAGNISIQVGSNTAKSQNVTKTGGTSDRTLTYDYSTKETGFVKLTVTCTTNSIYVKSIAITTVSSTTPTLSIPTTPINVTSTGSNGSLDITYNNLTISSTDNFGCTFYAEDGSTPLVGDDIPTWVGRTFSGNSTEGYKFNYSISANSGSDDRVARLKVYGMSDDLSAEAYSDLLTITQTAKHEVSFDVGEGVFVGNDDFDDYIVEVETGTYNLPSATREGWVLVGWNDGTNTYAANAEYTVNADVEFIAQWSKSVTATYTITSTSAVSTSGITPDGSSATFNNTYTSNKFQLTSGNSMTLTLSGYEGHIIKGITLSMHSNKSSGAGTLSVTAGSTSLASIAGTNGEGVNFNDASWYGNWSQNDFVDVIPTMSNANYTIKPGENVVITIVATANSLFCQSFSIEYEVSTDPAAIPAQYLIEAPAAGTNGVLNVTYPNVTDIHADIHFCDAEGELMTYDWVSANINDDYNVAYTIVPNVGAARTAYFKVSVEGDDDFVYSDVVTVTQAGASYNLALDYNPNYVTVNVGDENWNEFEFSENVTPVVAGTLVRISVAENPYCEVQSVTVSGISELPFDEEDHSYYFNMPAAATTITVTAAPIMVSYKYSINGVEGNSTSVQQGTSITLESSANYNDDFTFAGWTTNPNNVNQPLNGSYTLTESETTFYAVYAKTEMGVETTVYQKVTEELDNWSGEYLIVCESENVIFNGALETLDAASNVIEVSIINNTIEPTSIIDDATFTISTITNSSWYSIKNNHNKYIGANGTNNGLTVSDAELSNGISLGSNNNIVIQGTKDGNTVNKFLRFNNDSGVTNYRFRFYGSTTGQHIQLYKKMMVTPITTTYYTRIMTKEIAASQWSFIASPFGTAPINIDELSDLYFYDEQDHFWRNKKVDANADGFDFAIGKGYLGGNENNDVTLTFAGTVTGEPEPTNLEYHTTTSAGDDNVLAGWNLVGNPFDCTATLDKDCYIISGTAINTMAQTAGNYTVAPCEGVMVKATEEGQAVTFTKVTTDQAPQPNQLQLTVAQQVVTRNGASTGSATVEDNAIINFNAGSRLEKFAFNADAAKLYIPQNGKDYAIVSAEAQGEMPVNFRAAQDGDYTLSVNPEGVEMNYLHLIDNMTGADVDLLATPSYSFNATTRDYESRFRLVFAANNENGVSAGSTTFAYFSNGSLVVNNEGNATLQVVDVMGRIVKSESINGSASIIVNAAPGVYTLRLVNGNDVKTQKVVVR